jgi:hypothetical protein
LLHCPGSEARATAQRLAIGGSAQTSTNNFSAFELKRHLGVCYRTAWLVKHKLMEVMRLRED